MSVTPIKPEAPRPKMPPHDSILNWDATLEKDPKILAQFARQASTLAKLAMAGVKAESVDRLDDFEAELARECAALTDLLCFKIAKQLGALA